MTTVDYQPKATIAFVVAVARNGVIGRDNGLPWHLPGELKYFKERTWGRPLLMGRRTFASLGRPLPGRTNIVVTRDPAFTAPGAVVCHSLDEGLREADAVAARDGADAIMVIGGAELFAQLFPHASTLYLTRVEAEIEGDTWFPPWDPAEWSCQVLAEVAATPGVPAWTVLAYHRNHPVVIG